MVQFHVLELIFSWSGHLSWLELSFMAFNKELANLESPIGGIWLWADIGRNCNTFLSNIDQIKKEKTKRHPSKKKVWNGSHWARRKSLSHFMKIIHSISWVSSQVVLAFLLFKWSNIDQREKEKTKWHLSQKKV